MFGRSKLQPMRIMQPGTIGLQGWIDPSDVHYSLRKKASSPVAFYSRPPCTSSCLLSEYEAYVTARTTCTAVGHAMDRPNGFIRLWICFFALASFNDNLDHKVATIVLRLTCHFEGLLGRL